VAGDRIGGSEVQETADRLQRRVGVLLRVFGQQFAGGERSVRVARHHIGEGAAPVDPKIPRAFAGACLAAFAHARLRIVSRCNIVTRRFGHRRLPLQGKDAESLMSTALIAIVGFALLLAAFRRNETPEREFVPIRVDRRPRR
jgi:hypothetical protein